MDGFSKRDFESKSNKIIKIIVTIIIIISIIFLFYKIDIIQKIKSFEDKIAIPNVEDKQDENEKTIKDKNIEDDKKETTKESVSTTDTKKTSETTKTNPVNENTNNSTVGESSNKKKLLTCTKTETIEDDLKADVKFVFTFENDKLIFSKHDETIQTENYDTLSAYFIVLQEIANEFNANIRNGSYTKVLTDDKKITFNQVIDYKTVDTKFIKDQEYIDFPFTKDTSEKEVLSYMKQEGCNCK